MAATKRSKPLSSKRKATQAFVKRHTHPACKDHVCSKPSDKQNPLTSHSRHAHDLHRARQLQFLLWPCARLNRATSCEPVPPQIVFQIPCLLPCFFGCRCLCCYLCLCLMLLMTAGLVVVRLYTTASACASLLLILRFDAHPLLTLTPLSSLRGLRARSIRHRGRAGEAAAVGQLDCPRWDRGSAEMIAEGQQKHRRRGGDTRGEGRHSYML